MTRMCPRWDAYMSHVQLRGAPVNVIHERRMPFEPLTLACETPILVIHQALV